MGDDRNRILELLATGKITVEEATRLLDAVGATSERETTGGTAAGDTVGSAGVFGADTSDTIGPGGGAGSAPGTAAQNSATAGGKPGWSKFFAGSGVKAGERGAATGVAKFLMVKVLSQKGDNVNVKIPISLMRAGLKLTSLIPQQAQDQINKTMAEKGMAFDLSNFKPQDLEELIEALREMEIDIDAANGDKVKVYAA